MCATLLAPTGPWKGISEMDSAAEAPIVPSTSGGFALSTESTVMII